MSWEKGNDHNSSFLFFLTKFHPQKGKIANNNNNNNEKTKEPLRVEMAFFPSFHFPLRLKKKEKKWVCPQNIFSFFPFQKIVYRLSLSDK